MIAETCIISSNHHLLYFLLMTLDLSPTLSSDYERLYNDKNKTSTDISIHAGKEPNSKIFMAHTVILNVRSTYFLTKTDSTMVIVLEDIDPDVFECLLR
jgi:hypothetical protein